MSARLSFHISFRIINIELWNIEPIFDYVITLFFSKPRGGILKAPLQILTEIHKMKTRSSQPTACLELHYFGEDNNDWHTWRVSNSDWNWPSCDHPKNDPKKTSKGPARSATEPWNQSQSETQKILSEQLHSWWNVWCSFWWSMMNQNKKHLKRDEINLGAN